MTRLLIMRVLVVLSVMILSVIGDEENAKKPLSKTVKNTSLGHTIKRRKADNHSHNSYGAPVSTSYGSSVSSSYGAAAPASDTVDLHNKEFCVDVSTYQPVVWVERDGEECHTVFVKKCEDKSEDVCADVTETRCEVVPYTECSMGLEPQQFNETKLRPKKFVEKFCNQTQKTIPHKKLLPECRNITKQNCVTLWEKDEHGNQVWAGKEDCEPVTWQECKLVHKDVEFIVPVITCHDHQELWYHEHEPETDTRMTNTFQCQVKSTTHCTTPQRQACKRITWNECREVPVTNCKPKKVHVPTQKLLHRKKCLLPYEGHVSTPVEEAQPPNTTLQPITRNPQE